MFDIHEDWETRKNLESVFRQLHYQQSFQFQLFVEQWLQDGIVGDVEKWDIFSDVYSVAIELY